VKKIGNTFIIVMFLAFLFVIGLFTIFSPPKEASYFENRKLAELPEFSKEQLLSGEYFLNWETYIVDHIVGRDMWVKTYKQYERNTGKIEVGEYIVTNDDWILAKPLRPVAKEVVKQSVADLNELGASLTGQGKEFYFMFLPNKMTMIQLDLPSYLTAGTKKKNKDYFLSKVNQKNVKSFDLGEQFDEDFQPTEINEMFFKTDHHWNMNGAATGFKYVIDNIGKTTAYPFDSSIGADDYSMNCVDDKRLLGSWNKQLFGMIESNDERICYYTPQTYSFDDFEVYQGEINKGNLISWQRLYATGLNQDKDRIDFMQAYMGDYRELNIINPKKQDMPNVLIIKDSYVDPITFHFGNHFHRTTIYDVRFNTDRSLYEYLAENDFDMVVVLYNDSNVFSEMYDFENAID
jgi:hypothetical protein